MFPIYCRADHAYSKIVSPHRSLNISIEGDNAKIECETVEGECLAFTEYRAKTLQKCGKREFDEVLTKILDLIIDEE